MWTVDRHNIMILDKLVWAQWVLSHVTSVNITKLLWHSLDLFPNMVPVPFPNWVRATLACHKRGLKGASCSHSYISSSQLQVCIETRNKIGPVEIVCYIWKFVIFGVNIQSLLYIIWQLMSLDSIVIHKQKIAYFSEKSNFGTSSISICFTRCNITCVL